MITTLSPWLIYFADLCDPLASNLSMVGWITFFIGAIWSIINCFSYFRVNSYCSNSGCYEKCNKKNLITWKFLKPVIIVTTMSWLLATIIPSTKCAYKMMIIPPVVNSNVMQKLPDELQQYIDKVLSTKEDK